jgi:flagellar hook assembly protein FlgD
VVQFRWDGRSDDGREVGSGVYFIRARVGVAVQQRTFVLVR